MRSQLTRSVFRRLLSNEAFIFNCPRSTFVTHRRLRHVPPPLVRTTTRRSLFGFSRKPPKEPKEANLDPGLSKMSEFAVRDINNSRAMSSEELATAFKAFFGHKSRSGELVHNYQAKLVLTTLKYLLEHHQGLGPLNLEILRAARANLLRIPKDDADAHLELSRIIWAQCLEHGRDWHRPKDMAAYVEALTKFGKSLEARDFVEEYFETSLEEENPPGSEKFNAKRFSAKLWQHILSGFAREGNEMELLRSLEMAESRGVSYNIVIHRIMTTFYAAKDNIEETKAWYSKPILENIQPDPQTVAEILHFSIRNQELGWCRGVFRDLMAAGASKPVWDIVLQWAAGAMGKGVEDVEKMIEVMHGRSQDDESLKPDNDTINGLVELAMSNNDPYLAERYIVLGTKFGIHPNAKTFILQMSYRADANDLRGAQAAYDGLQAEEVLNDEDLPAINKYIRALCSAKADHYERIVSITSDLEERKKHLEAETVSALCKMYLDLDQIDELTDLLQMEAYGFTFEERSKIRETFMSFILDRNNNSVQAWAAYQITRHIFDETNTEQRTQLMVEFFERGRCDMASHIFGHMRQHPIMSRRPKLETYIQCFEGIASLEDNESLDMVHNMLKMDSSVEPNTRLYNSLMLAYTACDRADRALDFWDDITNSSEGPSYKSLEIVFRACGRKPFGDSKAREIWNKMKRMEIAVTKEVCAAYVGALAGQGKLEEARDMVECMEKDLGLKPDLLTIGTFYNNLPGQNRKDIVEEWAKEHYPAIWTELEKLGQTEQEEGHRLFNLKISMKA